MMPARYTVLPDVAEPWPGAGRPAWDAATHSHVLLRRAGGGHAPAGDLQRRMAVQLPGLLRMLDAGGDAEGEFTTWESVHGELLSSVLSRGPLSLQDYAHLSLQVLDTLAWLHEGGWRAAALGSDAVLLLHPVPGALPVFKIVSDIAPLGEAGEAGRKDDLHRFALMSWRALVGREFNPEEADIAGKLAQKRPDVPAGVGAALSAALGVDDQKRPSDARAMRQVNEMALGAQVQMAPAWMPPPMMYPPPAQHGWQSMPMMDALPPQAMMPPVHEPASVPPAHEPEIAVPEQEHLPEASPPAHEAHEAPPPAAEPPVVAQPPQPKPIAKPAGSSSTTALSKPSAATPGPVAKGSADAQEKAAAPAAPKPFPWGPVIGGTITLALAIFLGKIMFYPLWENWRAESRRRAENERIEAGRSGPAVSKTADTDEKKASSGQPVELPASNVAALRKEMKKIVTIHGKAVKTGESKGKDVCYLYFSEKPGAAAYLSVDKKTADGASLEALEKFVGKEVSATGEVSQYQGKLLLKIKAMSDIKAL